MNRLLLPTSRRKCPAFRRWHYVWRVQYSIESCSSLNNPSSLWSPPGRCVVGHRGMSLLMAWPLASFARESLRVRTVNLHLENRNTAVHDGKWYSGPNRSTKRGGGEMSKALLALLHTTLPRGDRYYRGMRPTTFKRYAEKSASWPWPATQQNRAYSITGPKWCHTCDSDCTF